jgi:hypothetical protein
MKIKGILTMVTLMAPMFAGAVTLFQSTTLAPNNTASDACIRIRNDSLEALRRDANAQQTTLPSETEQALLNKACVYSEDLRWTINRGYMGADIIYNVAVIRTPNPLTKNSDLYVVITSSQGIYVNKPYQTYYYNKLYGKVVLKDHLHRLLYAEVQTGVKDISTYHTNSPSLISYNDTSTTEDGTLTTKRTGFRFGGTALAGSSNGAFAAELRLQVGYSDLTFTTNSLSTYHRIATNFNYYAPYETNFFVTTLTPYFSITSALEALIRGPFLPYENPNYGNFPSFIGSESPVFSEWTPKIQNVYQIENIDESVPHDFSIYISTVAQAEQHTVEPYNKHRYYYILEQGTSRMTNLRKLHLSLNTDGSMRLLDTDKLNHK